MPPKRPLKGFKAPPAPSPHQTRRATGRNNELTESELASAAETNRQALAQQQCKKWLYMIGS